MIVERNVPIRYNISNDMVSPGNIVKCSFLLNGDNDNLGISSVMYIYHKNITKPNLVMMSTSNIEIVFTDKEDMYHELELIVPHYQGDKKECFVLISLDPMRYGKKAYLDDVKVNIHNNENQVSVQGESKDTLGKDILDKDILYKDKQKLYGKKICQQTTDKIIFVSTWDVNCGIAYYTKDLIDDLGKLDDGKYRYLFDVNPINNGILEKNIIGRLTHLQHEWGVMPKPPSIKGKVIMTWHTIPYNVSETLKIFENKLDIVGHIVPCEGALEYMKTSKDVHVIGLGSKLIADKANISQENARKLLGIEEIDKPLGFIFGFQSASKNYDRLIKAAKETDIHLIICGTVHGSGYRSPMLNLPNLKDNENITITNDKYMSDSDVDLYALASDLLLYDYMPQNHFSASSAMHRTVGAGKPVICSRINHFSDIKEVINNDVLSGDCLKFDSLEELEEKIKYALDNREEFENKSLDYAKRTSREEMARKHIEIYRRYVDI